MLLPLTGFLLSNCRLPRDFKLLRIVVYSGQSRRGLKWIVQPHPQIAIEEQLLPQQGGQIRHIENVGHSPILSLKVHLRFDPGRSKCFPQPYHAAVRITESHSPWNQCRFL